MNQIVRQKFLLYLLYSNAITESGQIIAWHTSMHLELVVPPILTTITRSLISSESRQGPAHSGFGPNHFHVTPLPTGEFHWSQYILVMAASLEHTDGLLSRILFVIILSFVIFCHPCALTHWFYCNKKYVLERSPKSFIQLTKSTTLW